MGFADLKIDVGTLFSGIGGLARDLKAVFTGKEIIDANKAAELALRAQELEFKVGELRNSLDIAQIELNKEEAKSTDRFVAGWRPAVGWICSFALGYSAILEPLMSWIARVSGYTGGFPEIDTTLTMQVLFGILGLGAYRMTEKIKKVAR